MNIMNSARVGVATVAPLFAGTAAIPTVVGTSQLLTTEQAQADIVTYETSGLVSDSDSPLGDFGYTVGSQWHATFNFDLDNAVTNFDPSAAIVSHDILSGTLTFLGANSTYNFSGARIIVEDADYDDFFNNIPDDAITFVIGVEDFTSTNNDIGSQGFAFNWSTGRDDVIDNPGFDMQTLNIFDNSTGVGGGTFFSSATLDMTEIPTPGALIILGAGGLAITNKKGLALLRPTREM